jgi:glycosyltransferase involved in cell wall biosynthesis
VRILHAITSANPVGGGVIAAIEQLARVHMRWGHTVEVVSLDDPSVDWLAQVPLKIYALGPAISSYAYAQRFVPWLKANGKNYDCIVINGLWQYTGLGVLQANIGVPYFVFPHGMLDPWFKATYPLKHLKKWLYWPWGEYQVLRKAKAVLFTCEAEKQLARQSFWLYTCRETVAHLGVDAPPGDPSHQRQIFLDRFPELKNKRLILFLGRLHVKKGCDLLIQAFARIAALDDRLQLVMAGPDQSNLQASLQKTAEALGIAERICWPGMLSGEMKWGALQSAEVFVLPSHQENFGIAVVEALACGLPVLISDKVNIWQEICADRAGLVAEDTLEGTVNLLQRWLALTIEEQKAMAVTAKTAFASRFAIEHAARRCLQIFQET